MTMQNAEKPDLVDDLIDYLQMARHHQAMGEREAMNRWIEAAAHLVNAYWPDLLTALERRQKEEVS